MPSEINYYDQTARNYNELHGEEQLNKLRIIAEHLKVKKSTKLLDVGCGSGLSAKVFKCNITGIDPSKNLLKQCPFKTVKASAESIPFPDHSFDVVIAVTCVHNFNNIEKGLKEILRVGTGCFVFSLLKRAETFWQTLRRISRLCSVSSSVEQEFDLILFCGSKENK